MIKGYIYCISNKINSHQYVGKTIHSIQERFLEHCKESKKERCENRPLYRAMRKYGIENFYVQLLEEVDISKLEETVSFLLEGNVIYEFRTTVVKQFHDEDSFRGIAEWIEGAENYYLQSFVDRETVHYSGLEAYGPEQLEIFKSIVAPHVKNIEIRGVDAE